MGELAKIYYDMAGSANPATFAALRHLTSMDHITFGTDWPFSGGVGIEPLIRDFEAITAGLSKSEREGLKRENALKLFPRLRTVLTGA